MHMRESIALFPSNQAYSRLSNALSRLLSNAHIYSVIFSSVQMSLLAVFLNRNPEKDAGNSSQTGSFNAKNNFQK